MTDIKKTTGFSLGANVRKFPSGQREVIDSIIENLKKIFNSLNEGGQVESTLGGGDILGNVEIVTAAEYNGNSAFVDIETVKNLNLSSTRIYGEIFKISNGQGFSPILETINMNNLIEYIGLNFYVVESPLLTEFNAENLEVLSPMHVQSENVFAECPNLSVINIPKLRVAQSLIYYNLPAMTGVLEHPALTDACFILAQLLPNITELRYDKLKNGVSAINIQDLNGVTTISFAEFAEMVLDLENFEISNCPNLTTINLPLLELVNGFRVINNASLGTLNLPSLNRAHYNIWVNNNSSLAIFDAPLLSTIQDFDIQGNPLLTTINVAPALTLANTSSVQIWLNGNALTNDTMIAFMDALIAGNASSFGVNNFLYLQGGNNEVLNATALARKATLVGYGNWTVTNN